MQNYNQQPPGYQRPGSTASFAGQPGPPPPPYGAAQNFQSTSPPVQSQWAPPAQNPAPGQPQWNQSSQQGDWGQSPQQQAPQQEAASDYNPGVYGAMPGAYNQGHSSSVPSSSNPSFQSPYPPQQQDPPPPPPPKPHGFVAAVQQQQQQQQSPQNWQQPPGYGGQQQQSYQSPQQNTGFVQQGQQGQQGRYQQQQGGFQNQGPPQQPYNNTVPPPPSQTPGGSYFPPSQGRPGSIYGADQAGIYSSPSSAVATQPPNSVLSPNEQQPAYIPPSLTGQGVQSYMPANTNPLPGVYVPPPPDIPAWQQAQHAPLQPGDKKFRYTKPMVDPSFQTQSPQGFHGQMGMQEPMQPQGQFSQQQSMQQQLPQQSFGQPAQNQFQPQGQMQQQGQFGQQMQPQQQFGQPTQQQGQFQQPQQPQQYTQSLQGPQMQQPAQQYPQRGNQWQSSPPANQRYGQPQQNAPAPYGAQQPNQQQGWQPEHRAQGSVIGQQSPEGQDQVIQAPKPINGHTGNTPPNFVTDLSPQSQPASPVQNRNSMSFNSAQNQSHLGRTSSVSSIALGAIRNQQAGNKTGALTPPPKAPTPSPPTDSESAFSALGAGGPSDWEHFGAGDDEIDDEELFGAKKEERKSTPVQLDSVELPVQPSPPSTADEWPTPPTQPAPPNVGPQRRDTYQPTPPPKANETQPRQQQSQGPFVMDEAIIAPAVTQSPQPTLASQPPPAQQSFVMDDRGWAPSKQSTPTQQQQRSPPASNTFVMDDGGWAAQSTQPQARQQTPAQQQQQPPLAGNNFVMDDGGWGAAQQTPNQASGGWGVGTQAQNQNHVAELKAKDEAYKRLRTDAEKEKADLRSEVERLTANAETMRVHAEAEKRVLSEQIESMKAGAEQAKNNADAVNKAKDSTIERLKEDIEGKESTIQERDAAIQDLRKQLEAEKQKEIPKPTPADLVPDIDPWYAGSLERYIAMLRSEASEPQVEDKIKVFTEFLAAESRIRGLDYYSAPPPAAAPPAQELAPVQSTEHKPACLSRGASNASARKQDMHVKMPQQSYSMESEPEQYSPGGRPILQRKLTFPSTESVPTEQSFIISSEPAARRESKDYQPSPITTATNLPQRSESGAAYKSYNSSSIVDVPSEQSTQSTTTLTPTSSTGDDFKTVQSPPEPEQLQYKPYVPGTVPEESNHGQSVSFATAPFQTSGTGKHDEIFFGEPSAPQSSSKPASKPTTGTSSNTLDDVPIPAPLSFTSTPTPSVATKDPIITLSDHLPKQIAQVTPNPCLEEIRKHALSLPSDFTYIIELTTAWERTSAATRAKNDRERHKRQEESEARTDQLFNDNEISYADIGAIEDEYKEQERERKAQEDRDEYRTYVESVFDTVYDDLQDQIKQLMECFVEVEALLAESVSGKEALEGGERPSTKEALKVLRELHGMVEVRHAEVAKAVAERDRRYKRTEIQPLYAKGDITKMKSVEKHFESAEKQAVLRAKSEKAERTAGLVKIFEEAVFRAIEAEQGEYDAIMNAIKNVPSAGEGRAETLAKARDTLLAIKGSSKDLLALFNNLECELNTAVFEAEIAQAKVEGKDASTIANIEREMAGGVEKLKEEFERRVGVLEQDKLEIEEILREMGVEREMGEEKEKVEKEKRMRAALEEAKRRNGDV
ncbi:hypothetical protein K469DRAFT_666011 [Zopfia rhizophila CBS 207.26]|uniref:Uncharacterized protein n=1 Tax=Zopfia rhizophila CBS 207.26 TaxID=1314779 RepID=A0A6A6E3E0_9PEZI|nr:hypothetical protein K469DRAFT_666011 [Zopfia rhizophila CBS 207.26]